MEFIKKFIPDAVLKLLRPFYHGTMAVLAGWFYGRPSHKMTVIGVTGTTGKSTTVQMLARILNGAAHTALPPSSGARLGRATPPRIEHGAGSESGGEGGRCGFVTTVSFFDGATEQINKHGLSMPGGWLLQKQLRQMADKGCQFAVIECTSEGLAQNRHLGIGFDAAIFTNISQAHIEAHGSFKNYQEAKGKLFSALKSSGLGIILANLDDPNAGYFLSFSARKRIGISFSKWSTGFVDRLFVAERSLDGFKLDNVNFTIRLAGPFNRYNALMAAAAANVLAAVALVHCARHLSTLAKIRGRMEPVENRRGISIFVDYGCEPASFKSALEAVDQLPHRRIIHVFGSTGGHRDKAKRFEFGRLSARFADEIIVTNDDVYDSDPEEIAENIESGIMNYESSMEASEIPNPKLIIHHRILDRRLALRKAIEIAEPGDIVLISGKGSEQFLVLPGDNRIEWDDVEVVKQELNKMEHGT